MKQGFHEKQFDESTLVKLDVFRRYAREWISVLRTRTEHQFRQLNIYDFFSGPGKDAKGIHGSPLIIQAEIKAYCSSKAEQRADIPVRLMFNDANPEHIEALRQEIEKARCANSCCRFEYAAEPFSEIMPKQIPCMAEQGVANLVLMDQFGVKEVTPEVVKMLLDCGHTDILFFISSSYLRRFIDEPELKKIFQMDSSQVKNVEYRTIHRHICDYYRSQLGVHKAYVAPFSIKKGSNIYGVIFATGQRRGIEKFLDVCWKLDPSTGESNYSIDDEAIWYGQQSLFSELNVIRKVDIFEKSLVDFVQKQNRTNIELYDYCLNQGFCSMKANESLRKLQNDGSIAVIDISTGKPARKGSFYLTEAASRVTFGVSGNGAN